MIKIHPTISKKYAPIFAPHCINCNQFLHKCTCGKKWDSTKARYIHLYGGRGRGGSHTATDIFLLKLCSSKYFRGYFMREIFADVRGSLWKDLMDRIEEKNIPLDLFQINETSMTIKCLKTGNEIISKGFKKSSGKSTAKLKSIAGATDVLIEEAEEVSRDDFRKLDDSLRTSKAEGVHIFLLFNMQHKDHHLHEDWYNLAPADYKKYADVVPLEFSHYLEDFFEATPKKRPDFLAVFSDYKDNVKNLDKSTVNNFLEYAKDEKTIEHFLSDIIGLVSSGAKGKIYRNWAIYKTLPPGNYYKLYGMDFGYSPDPTVLLELNIDKKKRRVFVKELFRQQELSTHDIYKLSKAHGVGRNMVICDSAEKRELTQLQNWGLNAQKSHKGAGSIVSGIDIVKSYNCFYHEDSKELIKEKENYVWELTNEGKPTGKPIDAWNHGNDAERYALSWYDKNYGLNYKS